MKVNWKQLVNIVATNVLPLAFPKLAPATPFIVHGIEIAEHFGGTGPEKLAKATEIALSGAQATNQIAGHEVIDLQAFNATIAAGISTVVQAANVVHKGSTTP